MEKRQGFKYLRIRIFSFILLFFITCLPGCIKNNAANHYPDNPLFKLTYHTQWSRVAAVPLRFNAFHTQGMVKVGEYFYMSSVEVFRWPKQYDRPQGKLDRDTGEGRGHIFKFDKDGNLLQDLLIGEGDVYHPGGLDYDGKYIWVPVTEYRPHSFSVIYKVDPETMEATEVMRYDDSIGAIAHDTDDNALIGVNWDAREFYRWSFDDRGNITNAAVAPEILGVKRGSHYVAYQDCQYLGNRLMLCSGHQSYKYENGLFRLGGWEIVDLKDFRPVHQIPVRLWSPSGAPVTNNPCAVEFTDRGIVAYFVPDDDEKSVLLIYETDI